MAKKKKQKEEPTLSDQHWRIGLSGKSPAQLAAALCAAVEAGNDWRFNLLLAASLDVNHANDCLEAIVRRDRADLFRKFHARFPWAIESKEPAHWLVVAAKHGATKSFRMLVEEHEADIHEKQAVLISHAAQAGCTDIIKYMVGEGVDLADHVARCASLAGRNGRLNVLKLLQSAGEDAEKLAHFAIENAVKEEHAAVVSFCLRQQITDDDMQICLYHAAEQKQNAILPLLLGSKRNPVARDWLHEPLFAAIENDNFAGAEMLIKAGADINADDGFALSEALNDKAPGRIVFILTHGGDPELSPADENSPLCKAVEQRSKSLVELLLTHGADPGDGAGSAYNLARETGFDDAIRLFDKGREVRMRARQEQNREAFRELMGDAYSMADLRTRKAADGQTGLLLAAKTGSFLELVKRAVGGAAPTLVPADLFHPDDGGRIESVAGCLQRDGALGQFFDKSLWQGRLPDMLAAYADLPPELRQGVSVDHLLTKDRRDQLRARNRRLNFKPPQP